jgi:integrase
MGFGDMTSKTPAHVSHYFDRHGNLRWRFRKVGYRESQTRAVFGSPDWWAWYSAALQGERLAHSVGAERTKSGSFAALIVAYYGASEFKTLAISTRATYRGILERFRAQYGELPVAGLEGKHVRALLDARAERPAAANNLLRMLKMLMRFAIERGWRKDDPTYAVRKVRGRTDGFHTWSEEEIHAFEAKHALGTRARLALALLLYTAQRRSDVVTMGRQHVRGGAIHVRQQKTNSRLAIPVHSELQRALDASPADNMTFLVAKGGKPFSPAGFTNWFRDCVKEAGLPDNCSPHGLRKAASRRLAEAGCSPHQIMAVTGHKGLKEVVIYTAAANQEQLARDAMATIKSDERGTTNV